MLKKITFLLGVCSLLFIKMATAQDMAAAWKLFNDNKRAEAREAFAALSKSGDSKAEAELSLALMDKDDDKDESAFKHFVNFFNASENPYPYLYSLWSSSCVFNGYNKLPAEKLAFLKKILTDPKANGTIKAMAHGQMGYHFARIGDFEKSNEEYAKIGAVENWQILGSFDNISGNGFNKNFGVLVDGNQAEIKFKNKVAANVKWFDVKDTRADKWFDFGYYMGVDNSIMYAQTFVNSPSEQEIYLRAGNSGSFKVWVNDLEVVTEEEERDCDLDVYTRKIKLNAGYNRIMVQVGASENDRANFLIRLTDEDGTPMNLKSESTFHEFTKATFTPSSVPVFAEKYFENKVKKNPKDLLSVLMMAATYMRNDKIYDARKALKTAMELAPKSTHVMLKMMEAYNRDNNTTDYTKLEEKLKAKDPDHYQSMKLLMSDKLQKEDYEEAAKILDNLISTYGESKYTQYQHLSILSSQKKSDEVIKLGNELYDKYPDVYDFMSVKYSIVLNANKDLKKANNILLAYLKNNYSDNVQTAVAGNYFKLGNNAEAIKIYQKRIENEPYKISFYGDLSDIYFEKQDYENALKWQQESVDRAPYVGSFWAGLGKIYEAKGDKEAAIKAYKRSVYLDPSDYDSRKQLRLLQGKKDLFEQFATTDVDELVKKAPSAEDYPEDNSIILLNETQRIIYPEGASEEHSEVVIKIFNQAGIDEWKEYNVGYNGYSQRMIFDKAEVIKKDGNKTQAERNSSQCVFTGLEAGDAIHVSYRIENYQSTKLSQYFWDKFNFNYRFPTKTCRYSMLVPAKKDFKWRMNNSDSKPTITDVDNYKMYVWETKDQPAVKIEPYMPILTDCGITLEYSNMPDWKYVANWYSDLSSSKAKSDFEIKEIVADLFAGKENLTELQKAKLIYEYIEKNMNYSNVSFLHSAQVPQRASRTLNTKLGDCKDLSTLFVAMCNEVGLKPNLMLVDTRDNGDNDMILPSTSFNHCIANIKADGKDYIVELTDTKLSFGTLPNNLLGSIALPIPRESSDATVSDLVKIACPNRVANGVSRTGTVKFEGNDMIVNKKNIRTGDYAEGTRQAYSDLGKEKQEKDMTQSLSGDYKNVVKLNSLSFGDLKQLSDTVYYTYNFTVKSEVSEVVGIKIVKIPWTERITSLDFVAPDKRTYDFRLWRYSGGEVFRDALTITAPAGLHFAEVPKDVIIDNALLSYSITYKLNGDKLDAVRLIKYKKDVVKAADYALFKETMNKISEADNKQLGFK